MQVPDGWKKCTLKNLIGQELISDGDWVESKDQNPDGNIKLVQLADVKDGYTNMGNWIEKAARDAGR